MRWFGRALILLVLAAAWLPLRSAPALETDDMDVALPGDAAPASPPADMQPAAPSADAAAPEAPWLSVRDVRVDPVGDTRRVVVSLTRSPVRVRDFTLQRPPRVVIDLDGPLPKSDGREARFPIDDEIVT